MDREIKNEFVKEAIALGKRIEEGDLATVVMESKAPDHMIKCTLGGYYYALIGCAVEGRELDLTYDTAANIIPAMFVLGNVHKDNDYDIERNALVSMKTLTAYLTLLMIENHDFKAEAFLGQGSSYPYKSSMWGDAIYLQLNKKKNSDLLPPALSGLRRSPVVMDNGFVLPVSPLLKVYKKLSGVDLEELGLVDIVVQFAD